ncbi:MAG: hypothetical protein WA667_12340 [Candidatus Nitrosopolaris sp.]
MTISSILHAAVYISCRETGTPRTIDGLLVIMSHRRNLQQVTEYFTWKLGLADAVICMSREKKRMVDLAQATGVTDTTN